MISVYENYSAMPQSLSPEEMALLHQAMAEEIGDDSDALELYQELIVTATRYISFRSNWLLWTREEKLDHDPSRTACHDSVIVRFNQLARYLKSQGRSTAWRDTLGDPDEDRYYRKRMGEFACYLAFVHSLLAR